MREAYLNLMNLKKKQMSTLFLFFVKTFFLNIALKSIINYTEIVLTSAPTAQQQKLKAISNR